MSIPYTPHEYQRRAIQFMIQQGSAGLFLDPGLGKTSITLAAFKILKARGLVKRMLVVAPLRPALSVWPGELRKWDDFGGLTMNVLHGPDKLEKLNQEADIDVINHEGLEWLFLQASVKKEWPWQVLVADESTRFKHTNTKRFKLLKPWLPRFRRRYALTGTPAPNGLMDLFGQSYILDLGGALGRYITHFRNSYFDRTGFGGFEWRLRPGAEKQIYEKLKPLVLRLAAEDYLKLPPLVTNDVFVELPPEARKAYDQMEALLITEVKGKVVTAANAAAATGKCRQIANGGSYLGDGARWTNIHDAKTEAVQEIVEELSGKPVLVAYEFRHDLERLQAVFPEAPHLGGGVTPRTQAEVERAWNAGELPVLFAQPQSVAHGLNLQGVGAAVVLHSLPWDLELLDQLVRRVWRQGQRERVVVHRIIARKTVDEAVVRTLAGKDRTQRALLGALRSYLDE